MSKIKNRFKKGLRPELKRINKNNSRLDEIAIFEKSLKSLEYIASNHTINLFNKKKNPNKKPLLPINDDQIKVKDPISFKVKHFIDVEKIQELLIEKKYIDIDYIMRNFTQFDNEDKKFNNFMKRLQIQNILIKRGFIKNRTYQFVVNSKTQSENQYNKEFYDQKTKKVLWAEKETWKIPIDDKKNNEFLEKHFNGIEFDNEDSKILVELLIRGDEIIEISYEEYQVEITGKGFEYLNNNWWQRNWKWVIPLITSGLIPILIKIFWK